MVTDFEFDGIELSSFGYAIVSFDNIKGDEITTDSKFTFNHISTNNGKQQPFATSTYDDPLEMNFYIAKNICEDNNAFKEKSYLISVGDMAMLKRWLVRATPKKLRVNDEEYRGIFWNGSFNVEEYVFGNERIGAKLTFECDAPFGYKETVTFKGALSSNGSYSYNCISDEIGWIYPTLKVKVLQDGDLKITNSSDGRDIVVKNCVANEVITFSDGLQISTSSETHKIANDFNYEFYRVNNEYNSIENTIESNLPIEFEIEYSPYAKVVAV